jgi:hypothetical protein
LWWYAGERGVTVGGWVGTDVGEWTSAVRYMRI